MKTALLASLLAAAPALAQVDISIDLTRPGLAVSPTHYGIFYEDINHSADGGLYAELVRNRSFEEGADEQTGRRADGPFEQTSRRADEQTRTIVAWSTVGGATMQLTTHDLLNDQQGHALLLTSAAQGDGVENVGYWGIRAVSGTQYRLSLWVRAVGGKPGRLSAALVDSQGQTIGEARLAAPTKRWQRMDATLTATANDPAARLRLTLGGAGQVALDVVSLFPPTYKNRPNGLRQDLVEMLRALRPRFVRFPGGCYVEGQRTPEAAFRWRRTVGPIERRPGHMGVNWGYWISDGMGFHEFLQMCEDLDAKPLYVVNVGIWHGGFTPVEELDTTWIQECMDALEYANGPADSPMGRLRAENGHPEPFNIEYVEIGNENANFDFQTNKDQSERYHERFAKFRDAIRAKYPHMVCIGNVEAWSTDRPSWRSQEQVDMLDEHYYRNPQWFAEAYHKYDTYDRQGPRIYAGEWAVTSQFGKVGNMNAALGEAVYMLGMENNSDVVVMNSYAPLLVNENAPNWPANLIHFGSDYAFGTPSYWAQQMFASHIGTRLLPQTTQWTLPEAEVQTVANVPVQVGVSAWGTRATFAQPRLTVDGAEVDLGNIATWQKPVMGPGRREGGPRMWRTRQEWVPDSAEATVTNAGFTEGRTWMWPQQFSAGKYSFSVRARKDSGAEGFMVVYNYRNERDFDWLNIGGWGNTTAAVEQSVDGGRVTLTDDCPCQVEEGRWYDVRIDVEGDSVAAYLDGEPLLTARRQSADMRGIFSNSTLDEATGTLYIKVVNVGQGSAPATVRLTGGKLSAAKMTRLGGQSGQDENTADYPHNVIPRPANVDITPDGAGLTFQVAPWSVNVIEAQLVR